MKDSLRHILDKESATKHAKDLVAKCGKGWKTRVFQNLGWHYNAIPKNKYGHISYTDLNEFSMWCPVPHVIGRGSSPRRAVREARDLLRAQRDEIERGIALLEETLKDMP